MIDEVLSDHEPQWSDQYGGWIFLDHNRQPYRYSTPEALGVVLVVDPYVGGDELTLRQKAEEWETRARAKREPRQPDSQLLTGSRPLGGP
jgi:hypothetical protein